MARRWFYKEEMFFTSEEHSIGENNQNTIIELLGKNVAVGMSAVSMKRDFRFILSVSLRFPI